MGSKKFLHARNLFPFHNNGKETVVFELLHWPGYTKYRYLAIVLLPNCNSQSQTTLTVGIEKLVAKKNSKPIETVCTL